jgi:hypothetical protein
MTNLFSIFWRVLTRPWLEAPHHSFIAIPENSDNLSAIWGVVERSGKQRFGGIF